VDQNILIAIVAVVAAAVALTAWLVWGRRRRVDIAAPSLDDAPPAPTLARTVTTEAADATRAMFDPPVAVAEPVRDPDNLMHLKGVGPRLAKTLYDMGIGKYAQIAAWTDADIDRVDAQLGPFAGRIRGDRLVDQARLLAAGDIQAYEAEFGKVGPFAA
jgi:predicted flap endonuclease-1-like 5' DNA nuclease